jgi:hypothetical protein
VTLAPIILKLWKLRLWVGVGIVLGVAAAVASVTMSHSAVYANASTQMLVDSRASALANAGADMTAYTARANVFARLMTTAEALRYIGHAARIPGNLIDASGPVEVNGSATATHAPVVIRSGKDLPAPATYKLSFVMNPSLPTVTVYAEAPTTDRAVALANGAVSGFASFINKLDGKNVPPRERIQVRQLGGATGGIVAPSASKTTAVLIFFGVFALWCGLVLFADRLIAQVRAARKDEATDQLVAVAETELPPAHAPGMTLPPLTDDSHRYVKAGANGSAAEAQPFRARPVTATNGTWEPEEQHDAPADEEVVRDEVGPGN